MVEVERGRKSQGFPKRLYSCSRCDTSRFNLASFHSSLSLQQSSFSFLFFFCLMESAARQRLTVQQPNDETDFTNEKTPSKLEGGTLTNDIRDNGAAAGTKDSADPPLTKSRRFKEFKQRIRGKHVEHVPTILESLLATVRASCACFCALLAFPAFSCDFHIP